MANLTTTHQAAAASSSTASSSYTPYDIFINHRGPDVKNTFASHLYRRLISKGVTVFLDREELDEGQNISSQIEHAIRGASVHIAIFSPTYAYSSWCLDELVLMKNSGATILPVFFKVEPSVVRHTVQCGAYAEGLRKLEGKRTNDTETGEEKPRYSSGTIENWRDALSYVADLRGFVHGDQDDEGELLDNVVKKVLEKVPMPLLDVAKYPTGLDLKLEDFEKTVLSHEHHENRMEAKVVGIVGMGGVGKTTLAKKFFNVRKSGYISSSFLFEVREGARIHSLNYLQSKLIKDLRNIEKIIESSDEGIGILRKYLSSCHALIILDDIDHVSQLEALLPIRDILSPDSLILATSRDKSVLKRSGLLESSIYNLEGLNRPHSVELFCSYAFNQPFPAPEFADLADRFVRACDGLPLSLKVFGALVCGENESYWEEILNELDKILPNTEIQERLEISYKSLSTEDKQIFIDIACFFLGENRDTAIRIWGMLGLQNLQNKCMLEVDDGEIKMHDHIRDLGRNIAQGVMPRRLWQLTTDQMDEWLEQWSRVITEVRGVTMLGATNLEGRYAMTPEMPWYKRWIDAFASCLRHLVNDSHFCGNLYFLATEDGYYLERILKKARSPLVRWLRCFKYPHSCLPSWIPMENLRVLDVGGDRLRILWQHDSQAPLQLRELRIQAPPFSKFPRSIGQLKHLEVIMVTAGLPYEGVALKSLTEEFCGLRSLKYLSLHSCYNLISLPDSFGMLTNLQVLSLHFATSLQTLPNSFGNLTRLKNLRLCGCRNLTISSSTLGNITTLEDIDLSYCSKVKELLPEVAHQRSLRSLDVLGTDIKELPSGIGELCNLESLSLGDDSLEVLPALLPCLKNLKKLLLKDSPRLKLLPDQFVQLRQLSFLDIRACGIEYLPQDLQKMDSLEAMAVHRCPYLRELPFKKIEREREMGGALNKLKSFRYNDKCMYGLQELTLWTCTKISELIFPEGVCPNLRTLDLWACEKLTQIGGLSGLSKLQRLEIKLCERLEELDVEMLISLEVLDVWGCKNLKRIPGLGRLTKLRELNAHECHEMLELSGAKHLMLLKKLDARNCPNLKWDGDVLEQLRQRLKEGLKL